MSTNINANVLKNFIMSKVGESITKTEAQKLGVEKEYTAAADELDVTEIEMDDIIQDNDLYNQFATMYVEERDNKKVTKDEEAEKQDQLKVQDKNGAGV